MTRWKEEKKERDTQCHEERHKHFYIVDYCTLKIYYCNGVWTQHSISLQDGHHCPLYPSAYLMMHKEVWTLGIQLYQLKSSLQVATLNTESGS